MRLLAIGDIHGHLSALEALLEFVEPTETDQFVFLGDYVDKGPEVKGVIDRLIQFSANYRAIFLRGNHDQMMIDGHREASAIAIWECVGGENPLSSYADGELKNLLDRVPASHWRFLEEECRDYYATPEFIFVHGGIRAEIDPANEERDRLLWTALSLAAPHYSGRTVICGHTPQRNGEIADLGHTICIDTGITRGGPITCLDLGTFWFWQANVDGNRRVGTLRNPNTRS
jgi:3',5'-cyclic AMP phosphodiesterase CpdA